MTDEKRLLGMGTQRRKRSWEETLMAFTLYFLLPKKEIDKGKKDVMRLADAIGRTPDAVALKAWNNAAYDPNRVASGRVGMRNGSKLDSRVWKEFAERGDELIEEGIELLAQAIGGSNQTPYPPDETYVYAMFDLPASSVPEGKELSALRMERVNQRYFRNCLLANYENRCCLTGLSTTSLLNASHIKPWAVSDPKTERLAASNGLLLNALHDRAFDKGLIILSKNLEIVVSSKVKHDSAAEELLLRYEGEKIRLPVAMPPAWEFIEYHNDVVFIA